MAKSVTLNLRIRTQGDGLDHTDVFTVTNNAAPQSAYVQAAPGFNGAYSSSAYAGMLGAVVVPPMSQSGAPSVSGVSKILKGISGDTGIPLNPGTVHVLPTLPGGGGFGLQYGAAEGLWLLLF